LTLKNEGRKNKNLIANIPWSLQISTPH
jgi:hypothetical protein